MTNTMSCGCEIISDNLGAYKIEYCPKHGAAPDMYEALEAYEDWLVEKPGYLSLLKVNSLRRKALAKAGERCIP